MATVFFNCDNVYAENKNLTKEDVRSLIHWIKNQPHLPDINEAQAILFLRRWSYKLEKAKTAVDEYFTVKTYFSDIFLKRNPLDSNFKDCCDFCFCSVLSQKSRKGYNVLCSKILSPEANRFNPQQLIKYVDIVLSQNMYEQGPCKGYLFIFDMKNFGLEMIAKSDAGFVRIFLYYLQYVVPIKFKQWHIIGHSLYVDKVAALTKLFMEKELADEFYVHQTLDHLYEHVPQSCLPEEYGGSEESLAALHDKTKKKILQNVELLDWENQQTVNESKRRNKSKSTEVIDLMERGSIRNGKFEID